MEQNCLEQIHLSINHCKNDIAVCEEQIKKCSMASLSIYEAKKFAFKDNLTIWNTMGHIQMTTIILYETQNINYFKHEIISKEIAIKIG